MYAIVDMLKAMACLMIFFYHCNTFLPGEWKAVTIYGEGIGNNLFFMVSGFALCASVMRGRRGDFFRWYLRRIRRVLPMLIIAYAASFISGYFSFKDPAQLVAVFIYPTLYWFATAILWFYILLWLICRHVPAWCWGVICAVLFALRQVSTGTTHSHYLMGFCAMLLGALIKVCITSFPPKKLSRLFLLISPAALGVYTAFAMRALKTPPGHLSYLISGLSALIFCASALYFGSAIEHETGRFVRLLGSSALALYLVQCFNGGIIGYTIGLSVSFPLSFPVNFVIVWGLTALLMAADHLISKCLGKLVPDRG